MNSASYQGLPSEFISEIIEPLKLGKIPEFRTIGAEFEYIGMTQVRGMGLDDESISKLAESSPRWPPRLLAVKRRWGGFPAHKQLQDGINERVRESRVDICLSLFNMPKYCFNIDIAHPHYLTHLIHISLLLSQVTLC